MIRADRLMQKSPDEDTIRPSSSSQDECSNELRGRDRSRTRDALSGEERLKLGVSELGGRVAHGPGQDILQRKGQDNLFTFL